MFTKFANILSLLFLFLVMEEQSATTSQPQLITQQPLPQAIPDSTAPKSTVAATVSYWNLLTFSEFIVG